MITTRRDRYNIVPTAYIAFPYMISTHGHYSAIRLKPNGMKIARRNCHYVAPVGYAALAILIVAYRRHRTACF